MLQQRRRRGRRPRKVVLRYSARARGASQRAQGTAPAGAPAGGCEAAPRELGGSSSVASGSWRRLINGRACSSSSRRAQGCTARAGEQQRCGVGLVVPTVTNSWLQCKTAATAREFRPNPSALRGKRFAPVAKSSQSVRGSLLSDPRRSVLGTLAL